MGAMERFPVVYLPWEFFDELYPFNAELLKGNAMLVRACGTQPVDGSILRSKEYILFGQGMATILPHRKVGSANKKGYIVEIVERRDLRDVTYWEVQSVGDERPVVPQWSLRVSNLPVVSDEDGHVRMLIGMKGEPGQYFFLICPV